MKTKALSLILALFMVVGIVPTSLIPALVVETEAASSSGIAIDETNFPDEYFRLVVSSSCDTDGDGYLSDSEIATTTSLQIYYPNTVSLEGIGYFTELTRLTCSNSCVSSLDLSKNTKLTRLTCRNNRLTSLDLSNNTALTSFSCSGNSYTISGTTVDLANLPGNFDYTKMSNIAGGTVKNGILTVNSGASAVTYDYDCGNGYSASFTLNVTDAPAIDETNFPDDVFREYVSENIDTDGDGYLSDEEIQNTTSIYVVDMGISSLEGVEYFTELVNLWCGYNNLTEIDLSQNVKLKYFDCKYNNLVCLMFNSDILNVIDAYDDYKSDRASRFYLGNAFAITLTGSTYDLSKLTENFDYTKMSNIIGGTVKGGILTVDDDAINVSYYYDCGSGITAVFVLKINRDTSLIYPITQVTDLSPEETDNSGESRTIGSVSTEPVRSFLTETGDGLMRVEYVDETAGVVVEYYDSSYNLTKKFYVTAELALFGGFYATDDAYYLIFGQKNTEEDDAVEAIRVVKYTHDWVRLDHASVYGVVVGRGPFSGCNLSVTEKDDCLYIYTGRENYNTPDGLHHQSSLELVLDTSNMVLWKNQNTILSASHCFATYTTTDDDGNIIEVAHCDAGSTTRGIRLSVNGTETTVFAFGGNSGNNTTFAFTYGVEYSSSSYLIVGRSIDQGLWDEYQNGNMTAEEINLAPYNVFVTVTSKDDVSSDGTSVVWITDYDEDDGITVLDAKMVKVSDNKFLVLWATRARNTSFKDDFTLNYVFIDGKGNKTSKVYSTYTGVDALSDCQPIVVDGVVTWYTTGETITDGTSVPTFYMISSDGTLTTKLASGSGGSTTATYTVTFNSNGGTSVSSQTVSYGSTATEPTEPTRYGYTFDGWYTAASGGSKYSFSTSVTSNVTLYAHWTAIYKDVSEGQWFYESVMWAYYEGVMTGTGTRQFDPNESTTRAQLVTVLYRMVGSPTVTGNSTFTDLNTTYGQWYIPAVTWAQKNSIVNGTSATTFSPDDDVTREQIATILWRYVGEPSSSQSLSGFSDSGKIDDYAKTAMTWAVENGIFKGDDNGLLNPLKSATRAEIATILQRFCEKFGG